MIRPPIRLPANYQSADVVLTPTIRCEHTITEEGIELNFHDVVGSWWDESTSGRIAGILSKNKGKPVRVSINSPGGSAWDAIAIYNLLVDHEGEVTTQIEANAASAATIIGQAGDRRLIRDNASIMVHRSWLGVIGNAGILRAEAEILDKVDQALASVYAARAGGTIRQWLNTMKGPKDVDGTWYTADEALEAGLVDEVTGGGGGTAQARIADPLADIHGTAGDVDRQRVALATAARLRSLAIAIDNR